VYHISKRGTEGILSDLVGVELSLGSVTSCEAAVSQALEKPVEEAKAFVQDEPVKHADETSWRERRRRAWLWVVATAFVTVFQVDLGRGTTAARKLLQKVYGILVSDRWVAYNEWPVRMRQLCWAHLQRQFQAMAECVGGARRIGRALVAETVNRASRGSHRSRFR
jgi:transposase